MKESEEVSVCIVSYNSGKYLGPCLDSIAAQTHRARYEVIVVDNGSNDGSVAALRRDYPEVRVIESSDNVGFAKASNRAAREAKGEYLLFLNPDTELRNDAIGLTLSSLRRQGRADAATCRIHNPDGTLGVSRKGEAFFDLRAQAFLLFRMHRLFPRSRLYRRALLRVEDFSPGRELFFVAGCFLLMRRDFFLEIGLYDERFFLYAEDADLCLRIRKAGGRIFYFPEGEVLHWEKKSSPSSSLLPHFYMISNRFLLYKKHRGYMAAIVYRLIILFSSLLKGILGLFRRRKGEVDRIERKRNRSNWQWALGIGKRGHT